MMECTISFIHPFVQIGGILQGGDGPLIQQYNGYIDNVYYWSYPLTSNEIQNKSNNWRRNTYNI